MPYLFDEITIPAQTTEGNAIRTVIPLALGRIDRIDVSFPDGCVRLARCKMFFHGVQVLPFNLKQSVGYNNFVLQVPTILEIQEPPYELVIFTWNLDDTYQHTLSVGFVITYQNEITNPVIDKSIPTTITVDS